MMKLKISIATIKKMIHIVGFDLHLHSPFEKKKKSFYAASSFLLIIVVKLSNTLYSRP